MATDIRQRRFPKVLADKLRNALDGVRDLGHEMTMELLARHRRNLNKYAATVGLTFGAPKTKRKPVKLEPIPLEYLEKINALDEAFQALHRYRNDGAEDYASADVERALNRARAQLPREHHTGDAEICAYLKKRDYPASENKQDLVADACSHFDVSESTIRRAARKGGLTKKNRLSPSG